MGHVKIPNKGPINSNRDFTSGIPICVESGYYSIRVEQCIDRRRFGLWDQQHLIKLREVLFIESGSRECLKVEFLAL
jgi:hypothetical protein